MSDWKQTKIERRRFGSFVIAIDEAPRGGYTFTIRSHEQHGLMPLKTAEIAKEIGVRNLRHMLQEALDALESEAPQ